MTALGSPSGHTARGTNFTSTSLFSKLKYKSVDDNEVFEDFDLLRKTPTDSVTNIPRNRSKIIVTNVQELREAILKNGAQLSDIDLKIDYSLDATDNDISRQHEVLRLMHKRFLSDSKPNRRHPNDKANKLALAIEGGGMRGAVSAGMTAALVSLGLEDTVDIVYGSSAGCVIAAYLLSGQMCIDIYTKLLPDAKSQFVCKKRLVSGLCIAALQQLKKKTIRVLQKSQNYNSLPFENTEEYSHLMTTPVSQHVSATATAFTVAYWNNTSSSSVGVFSSNGSTSRTPGMNISFILDEIMCPRTGMRPFDIKRFHQNHKIQPLRVVSSVVKKRDGRMETIAFGSQEEDFYPLHDFHHEEVLQKSFENNIKNDHNLSCHSKLIPRGSSRNGLFACLEASMTVPGAAGPPKNMKRRKAKSKTMIKGGNQTSSEDNYACFDAFVFEPMPYRSAVEEGATHVLVFRSRPMGCKMDTKPGFYEKIVAPLYFRAHGLPDVGKYFHKGGQQYRYIEDVLTLQEGYKAGLKTNQLSSTDGRIPVPPTKLLYGVDKIHLTREDFDVQQWKQAHLLPIVTPNGAPELQTLDQDKGNVIEAVRNGYAAAFDMFAPLVGIKLDSTINGKQVAELLFPDSGRTQKSSKLIDLLMSTASNEIGQQQSVTGTPSVTANTFYRDRNILWGHEGHGSLLSFLPGVDVLSGKQASLFENTKQGIRT